MAEGTGPGVQPGRGTRTGNIDTGQVDRNGKPILISPPIKGY